REAPGWWRFSSSTTPRRRSRRLCPSFAGGERSPLSPPRQGVARSAGVVAFQFPHHPSATVTLPLPLLRRRGALSTFPSSSRRGGAKRRGGGVAVPPPPLGDGPVASAPPWQKGSALHFPLLVEEGWREAPGW